MPRGGKRPGAGSALTATTATPEELNNLTSNAKQLFIASVEHETDLHNPDDVTNTIIAYFERCEAHGLRPGNLGMYAALNLSRQDVNTLINGRSKSKASPESIDIIKKAIRAIGQYREGLALEGKLNPVTYIFMGKNYDGLEDQTRIEVAASSGPAAQLTPAEVAKQIEKDIPIDADYQEIAADQDGSGGKLSDN